MNGLSNSMKLYDLPEYQSTLKKSIPSILSVKELRNRSILITGATGLIGSSIVEQLLYLNDTQGFAIRIYAGARNVKSLENRFGQREDIQFVSYDAVKPIAFAIDIDYLIHAASNASPELYVQQPVETMTSNFLGMYHLLEYAREHQVKRVVYISSSEVYGQKENDQPFMEDEYGFMDILNVRSSYGSAKRATETLCSSYAYEYDLDVMIVRPGHIYGPSAKRTDNRISSTFVYQAISGQDLIMKSEGSQLRSYCYHLDCSSAILTVLLTGERGQSYNISNPKSIISIRQMAALIAQIADVNLRFDLPKESDLKQANPMENASLNSSLLESLGWSGIFDAQTGFEHTINIVRELVKNDK